jgi:hypothetical protein
MIKFENYPGWGKLCDEFRQTPIFKQSNGKDLHDQFYEWITMEIIKNADIK